jgi:aminopeptidase 2
MCRHALEADAGGSIDIAKGREVLPKNVKPTHYNVTLEPNFETFEYDGKVEIEYVYTSPWGSAYGASVEQ